MTVPYAILQLVEKAIEAVLRLDPETRSRLASLNGKVVRVNVGRPTISLMLAVADGNIHISEPDDTLGIDSSADTIITGDSVALRSLLRGNDAVYTGKVKIEGDIGTSQQLKQIVAKLDPNWQDAIAPYLGDGLTHRLDVAQARFGGWLKRTRESARLNTSDYLQEEIEVLAPNSEVRQFCSDVDEVRAATDRLAARVQQQEASARKPDVKG